MTHGAHPAGLHLAGLRVARGPRVLLDVPELHFAPGRLHAVLGPNGAGKSTLLHALAGLSREGLQQVRLQGRRLVDWPPETLARTRALMPQDPTVPAGHTALEVARLGRHPYRRQPRPDEAERPWQALHRAGVADLAPRRYDSLSGGERARVQLARALAQLDAPPGPQPRWLLLDEPTAALDLAHQHAVMRLARELAAEGLGVVAVLHDLNLAARYAHHCTVLAQGRIQAHGPTEAVLHARCVQTVWKLACRTVPVGESERVQFLFE